MLRLSGSRPAKSARHNCDAPDIGGFMPEQSDVELLALFQKGDQSAFEELVLRHRQLCYSFIYRMVGRPEPAEDLFQDTWLKVVKNAHTYKPKAKFTTWLIQIARNTVLDYFKRESLRRHASLDVQVGEGEANLGSLLPSDASLPDELVVKGEAIEEVQRAMRELVPQYQEVLVMRLYHKLSYAEIGEIVGSPEGTVKYWVHEAMKALSGMLTQRGVV